MYYNPYLQSLGYTNPLLYNNTGCGCSGVNALPGTAGGCNGINTLPETVNGCGGITAAYNQGFVNGYYAGDRDRRRRCCNRFF